MARFEMGSAWVSVHADTSEVNNEVKKATTDASKKNKVTVNVEADQSKLDGMKRKLETLGNTAQQVGLRQERAQLAVNRTVERYQKVADDAARSDDERADATNRIAMAQTKLEAAQRKVLDVQRQQAQLQGQTGELEAKIKVTLDAAQAERERVALQQRIERTEATMTVHADIDVDKDIDKTGSKLTQAFSGIGSKISGLLTKALSGVFEGVMDTGSRAMQQLGNAGIGAASGLASAAVSGTAMTAATGGLNIAIGILVTAFLALVAAVPMAVGAFLALAPAIMVAAGAMGVGMGAAVALGSVMGTLALGFGGLSEALGAYEQDQGKATQSTSRGASQALSNAISIRNAETAISDARRSSARAATEAAARVRGAQEALADAQQAATERIKSAQQSLRDTVRNAADQIADAQERLSEAHEDAAERVEDAEERVTDAKERAKEAEEDLNEARKTALERLEDLKDAAMDAAEQEKRAAFKVREAMHELQVINSHLQQGTGKFTEWDRAEAVEKLRQAQVELGEAQEETTKTTQQSNDAQKAGAEGDKRVVDAKKQVTKANQGVQDAQKGLSKAQREAAETIKDAEKGLADARREAAEAIQRAEGQVAKAKKDGADQVADAQKALAEAQKAQRQAQDDGNRAVGRAIQALGDLKAQQAEQAKAAQAATVQQSAYQKAMDKLPPSAQALVKQLISMKDMLDKLKKTASDAMLPSVTQMLKDTSVLFPVVNDHVRDMGRILGGVFERLGTYLKSPLFSSQLTTILDNVEDFVEHIGNAITKTIPALVSITEAASPLLKALGGWIEKAATKFADWIESARRSGKLQDFFDKVGIVFGKLSTTGKLVFQIIGDIVGILFDPSRDASDSFLDGVNTILEKIHKWLGDPKNQKRLKDIVQAMVDFVQKVFTKENMKKVGDFFDDMKDFATWIVEEGIPAIKDLKRNWDALTAPFRAVATGFSVTTKAIKDKLSDLKTNFSNRTNDIKAGWKTFWDTGIGKKARDKAAEVKSNVSTWWGDLKTKFRTDSGSAGGTWSSWWSGMSTKAGTWRTNIRNGISGWWTDVRKKFTDSQSGSSSSWGTFWSNLNSKAGSWRKTILDTVGSMKTQMIARFKSLPDDLLGVLRGVKDKINTGIGKINTILPSNLDIPSIPKFADGGHVRGPGGEREDRIPALLSDNEYVLPAKAVREIGVANLDRLRRGEIGIGGDPGKAWPAYADGGLVTRTQQFIRSTDPLPYVFGSIGPRSYDCSGITGEVMNRLQGRRSYVRRFTTRSNFEGLGFKKGRGTYTVGVNAAGGHMAGNLGGLPFEAASSRSGIKVGASAKSVTSFPQQYYLPSVGGQFVGGGGGSGSDFSGIGAIIGSFASQIGSVLAGLSSDGMRRLPKGVAGIAQDKVKARIEQATGFMNNVVNNVQNWAGGVVSKAQATAWVAAAMAATGKIHPKWMTGMLTLTKRESNWNPNAVNNWDSNARRGTPSKGIAQTIQPTFDAHNIPGLGGIFNPVANIAAAIRYIDSRYGDISRVQQANPNLPPKGYDNGGLLMPGYTLAYNGTGRAETIRTASQEASLKTRGGDGATHLHFAEGAVQIHCDELSDVIDLADMIKKAPAVARRYGTRRTTVGAY